jgi:hypothetical protein
MKTDPILPWILYAGSVLIAGIVIVAVASYWLITPFSDLAWQQELMGLRDLIRDLIGR